MCVPRRFGDGGGAARRQLVWECCRGRLPGLSAGVAITATLLLVDLSPLLRALPAAGGLAAGLSLGAAEDDGAPLAIGERVAGLLLGALLGLLIASGLFVVNLDTATLRPFDENSLLLRAIAALLGGE